MRRSLVAAIVIAGIGWTSPAAATETCTEPAGEWARRAPSDVEMDGPALQDALDWATTHTSQSVLVIRHGCLVGESRLDPIFGRMQLDGWSMTKSVTAMLAGRAVTLGLLDVDEPIARLFPEADAEHGALTPRHLLTMTAGTHRNWVRDLSPMLPDRVRDALALPFDHEPGAWWEYQQSNVTLLGEVIRRAVGAADLQAWAQDELFAPIGIDPATWSWDRDRAGHTEGWAHLKMQAASWARLGQLMLRNGSWNGTRLISPAYVAEALTSVDANHAYGFLFWLNGRDSFVLPNVEGYDAGTGPLIASAPSDAFIMAGAGEQRVYVIPSRDMVIVRLGDRGSREGDTRVSVWTGRGGELDNELVRRVMLAVDDVAYADPGPYPGSAVVLPPHDDGIVGDAWDTDHVLAGFGLGAQAPPGCSPLGCE